jgi:hypothetical protein
MSKLSDKIRKALRLETAPLGFRAAARERTPSLLIVVRLDDADPREVAVAVEKGADSVLLCLAKPAEKEVKKAVEAAGETPCGVWPEGLDGEAVSRLMAAGVDYLVFGAENTPAPVLLEEKAGYVLVLEEELSDTYLRTVDLLPLDAVFLPQGRGALSVRSQMELRRIAWLTRKPVMLPVSLPAGSAELECLRDSGVTLLLVDGGQKGTLEGLPALRQAIEGLPAPRRRREERMGAVLPRPADVLVVEEEEEEEEGEEEDL